MGNVSTNVYAKFRCALLRTKKALGIFGCYSFQQKEEEQELEGLFGTRLPDQKKCEDNFDSVDVDYFNNSFMLNMTLTTQQQTICQMTSFMMTG